MQDPLADIASPITRHATFRKGVALGMFYFEPDDDAQRTYYSARLDEIAALGATDVSLVVRWHQRDVRADTIAPTPALTPSDEVLGAVITGARARGLRVLLMPILHIEQRGPGLWRGALAPERPDAWWDSYTRFISHYAALGAQHKVEALSVGSELASLEHERARWLALIKRARARFDGTLTYSANWDHFEEVSFWDALDVAGISAYHELSHAPDPDLDALRAGWRPFLARVRAWSAQLGRPYWLTEIGYPSHSLAASRPWDYNAQAPIDHDLQARCYRAMFDVWDAEPELGGLYLWNWFDLGGPEDAGYTARGKRAQALVRGWYRGTFARVDTLASAP